MEIFHYNPDGMEYIGASVADESPLEPGVFLVPAYATTVAPPPCDKSQRAIFDGYAWRVEPVQEAPPVEDVVEDSSNTGNASIAVCTDWQIRKALNQLGLRQAVESAVAASTDQEIKDGWEFATQFRSDHPFVIAIGQALGKTPEEITQIITMASAL